MAGGYVEVQLKNYTVTEIEVACRALEATDEFIYGSAGSDERVDELRHSAIEIIRDGLDEIVAEHRRANEALSFIPGPIGKKGERA